METPLKNLLVLIFVLFSVDLSQGGANLGDPGNVVLEDGKVKCLSATGIIWPHPSDSMMYVFCLPDPANPGKFKPEIYKCGGKSIKYEHGKGCLDGEGNIAPGGVPVPQA